MHFILGDVTHQNLVYSCNFKGFNQIRKTGHSPAMGRYPEVFLFFDPVTTFKTELLKFVPSHALWIQFEVNLTNGHAGMILSYFVDQH